jgi:cytochrome c oxidase subunit 3
MWLFLATELILFGGLFILYAGYRFQHPEAFVAGSQELDLPLGTINTVVLVTSSFFVALAILAAEKGKGQLAKLFLWATIAAAIVFTVIKGFEWGEKFTHGLYPNSETMLAMEDGKILYFGLYYTMTGLHALHVIGGGAVLAAVLFMFQGKTLPEERMPYFENAGLFWHLVDVIWIFLFPLFYLIG